jgi:hypothetical protein
MPTEKQKVAKLLAVIQDLLAPKEFGQFAPTFTERDTMEGVIRRSKPKRKLSAWNKFVKANSKKPRFRYRNGKLNLKKMAVAFRKTKKRGGR